MVDQWVSEVLKSRFLQKPAGAPDRSLWDKFKQGITNWWWGPKGDKWNPYVWRNRFGDELGVSESFDPSVFSLHEYTGLKSVVESVESSLNEAREDFDSLRLMKLVRSAAEDLKSMLFRALDGKVEERPTPAPSAAPPSVERPSAAASAGQTEVMPGSRARAVLPTVSGADLAADSGVEREKDKPSQSTSASDASYSEPMNVPTAKVTPQSLSAATEPTSSAGSARKTNRARIEGGAEEIAAMDGSERSRLVPHSDWVGRDGNIRKDRLAHALAWMAMKPHVDPLDDETIKDELKKSLGKEVGLGVPGSSKGVLRKYLEDTLFGNFKQVMGKLGIEVDSPKQEEETRKKDEKGSSENKSDKKAKSDTSEIDGESSTTRSDKKPEDVVDRDDDNELKKYFQNGRNERPIKESIELVLGFLRHLGKDLDSEKRNGLKGWWEEKRKELMDIYNSEDRRDALFANVVGSEAYIDQISSVIGLDASSIKNKMIEYIKPR